MMKMRVLKEDELHQGYVKVVKYDVEVPSLNPEKSNIHLTEHEIVHTPNSVHVLLYIPKIKSFLICQELRLGVLLNNKEDNPVVLECVCGTIEPSHSPLENAKREVYEETGIHINQLELITIGYKSAGLTTEKTYIYYSELEQAPQVGYFGVNNEEIKTKIVSSEEVFNLLKENKIFDLATVVALNWFYRQQLMNS